MRLMKIYVASSWKNKRQPLVVETLRLVGRHEVYDFRHPVSGDYGFSWRQCVDDISALVDPCRYRDEVLQHPAAQRGFDYDMSALEACDALVLVLPSGRSAHLELGWAAGAGKRTIVLLDDPLGEPELMYLACTSLVTSFEELLAVLGSDAPLCEECAAPRPMALRTKCSVCGVEWGKS